MAAIRRRVRTDLETKWVDIFDLRGGDIGQVLKIGDEWVFMPGIERSLSRDELREIADQIDAMRAGDDV